MPTPTSWALPPANSHGGCQEKTIRSASIGKDLPYIIYLPPGYSDTQTTRRYPVVYLLSGLGGNYKEWAYENINLCTQMDGWVLNDKYQPMIVVMPTGREDSDQPGCDARYPGLGAYWFNHPPPPASDGKRWSDFVWNDLVNAVDASYRTIPSRTSRAVGGLSAGANGALSDALNHPDVFAFVASHSASFRRADGALQCFGTQEYFNQYDPIWLVQNKQTWRQLSIWLDDGDRDQEWGQANREFRNLLLALGIPHEWHELYGDHVPPYWAANVKLYMQWYSSNLRGQ